MRDSLNEALATHELTRIITRRKDKFTSFKIGQQVWLNSRNLTMLNYPVSLGIGSSDVGIRRIIADGSFREHNVTTPARCMAETPPKPRKSTLLAPVRALYAEGDTVKHVSQVYGTVELTGC